MDLIWIEDFLALSRTLSFSEAATQRCTTQPAFSRRMRQLEGWLGSELFDRTARPVRLTQAGEDFLRRAQRIREDILDARRIAMASKSHVERTERIYTTTAIAVGIVPNWLEGRVLNHTILTSSTGGCLEALHQKRADKVLLPWFYTEREDQVLHYEKIMEDRLVLVESPKTVKPVVLRGGLLEGPLLMHTPGTIFGQQILRRLSKLEIGYGEVCCESSSAETLLGLVKQGFGAAWVPESLAGSEVRRCGVPARLDVPFAVMVIRRREEV